MDSNELINSISSVGFPIIACIILFYFNKVEIEKLRETIENNTKILESLKDIIKGLKRGDID